MKCEMLLWVVPDDNGNAVEGPECGKPAKFQRCGFGYCKEHAEEGIADENIWPGELTPVLEDEDGS